MTVTMKLPILVFAGALAFLAGGVGTAEAQVSDHLKCYRVKDTITGVKYQADLTGLAVQPGCRVKARAKWLCVSTTKTGVTPTPPGGGPTVPGAAGKFMCYRVKCPPHAQIPGNSLNDQFGVRSGTAVVTQLLCAPASPSGAFLDTSDLY